MHPSLLPCCFSDPLACRRRQSLRLPDSLDHRRSRLSPSRILSRTKTHLHGRRHRASLIEAPATPQPPVGLHVCRRRSTTSARMPSAQSTAASRNGWIC
uniref:Uncharacterized protein n=1 Tax=Leersia perrieri TaxID=77586 RepID=A0A0D9XKG5_9ORYZ